MASGAQPAGPKEIRNIALIGHANSGKTAIVDALAYVYKITPRQGDSADGTSLSNTEPEEKERKHTLTSHVFRFDVEHIRLNVIDTPGHPDFLAEAIAALQVVETCILTINAAAPITFHARRLWDEAGKAGIGRAIVLTHVDDESADVDAKIEECFEVFGDVVAPLTYPDAHGPAFSEIRDVLEWDGPRAEQFRERIMERVALADDEMLQKYLDEGKISKEEVIEHLPAAIAMEKFVPLFAAQPKKAIGFRKLVHHIEEDFPSPISFGPRGAAKAGSDSFSELVEPDDSGSLLARVFKVVVDPYVGRQTYLRVMRGTLPSDIVLQDARTGASHKVHGLLAAKVKETSPLDMAHTGDVAIITKVEGLEVGDTLYAEGGEALQLKPLEFPEPIYSLAIEPKNRGDEAKISEGLEKLRSEDPTFQFRRDESTAELVISGSSPLHLEVHMGRLAQRYGVEVVSHPPTIPYKETMTAPAEGHHRHKKQSGGRGQFAEVYLRVGPLQEREGFEFVDSVVGGSIPRQFIPEVEKGIRRFLDKGALAGFPVVGVRAEVYDGKFHDVDSDQLSFQLAGERAFAEGYGKARPILLEPIMDVEVHIPERFTGDVAGSLSSMRGRMSGMELQSGVQTIQAQVPLAEMQDFSTQLRSMTAGEGSFTMQRSHYEPVPPQVQQQVVAARQKKQED